MKKHTKVALSFFLIVCIILSCVSGTMPVAAIGSSTVPQDEEIGASAALAGQVAEAQRTILHEDVSLRKEYEKHFLMSDGSYQVALYNDPVHKMEDGNWVEIDNTLILRNTRDGTVQYATTNGLVDVRFAQNFGSQLVTMQQEKHSIAWELRAVPGTLNASTQATLNRSVQAEIIADNLSAADAEEQKTFAVKSTSALQYRNALASGVDLEYVVLPSKIKENIILHSKQDIAYYTVTVHLENLSARLLENREIEFYNDNEVVFTMTSPYMYDSAGELSENIAVELISRGNGSYDIKMTPDVRWLSSKDRVYPIVIDPQVSVNSARSNIIDNYVLEGSGNQNRNLDRLYIGNKSGKLARAFIKYDTMPTLPEGAQVTDATMTLTILNGTSTASNINAYQVTGGDWASDTITWANMPSTNTRLAANISHNNLTKYTFSCRVAAQYWYRNHPNGDKNNYGFMFRYYDETIADYNAVYSADCSSASKRPAMVIYYTGEDDGSDSGTDSGPDFEAAESIALDGRKYVQITGANEEKIYKFIPPIGGEYLFYSSNATSLGDPYVTVYSSSGSILHSNDDSGGNNNFRLSATLSSGNAYYIGVKHTGNGVGPFYLNILIACSTTEIADSSLRNVGSSLYLNRHQDILEQRTYSNMVYNQWQIQKQSDGYFTIQAAYAEQKYVGISSTSTGTDNIQIYSTSSDNTLWKIYVKSTGEMLIEPKSAMGKVLYAPNYAEDTALQLTYISHYGNNLHEWKIECQSNAPLEGQQGIDWCWVASARMFARHYVGNIELTQAEVEFEIKEKYGDYLPGGNAADIAYAIGLFISSADESPMELQYNLGGSNGRIFSENTLRRFINDGHVIILDLDCFDDNNTVIRSHAILLVGYSATFSNGTLQYRYTINDPYPETEPPSWDNPPTIYGKVRIETYARICNIKNVLPDGSTENWIWRSFVAAKTNYSEDTCPPVMN